MNKIIYLHMWPHNITFLSVALAHILDSKQYHHLHCEYDPQREGSISFFFHCSILLNHLLLSQKAAIWNSSSRSCLSAMRTTGRPHVFVWSRRKLAAPEWQGKGSYPQRDCDLHTNSHLIDLHLIWPLKLVEGSPRTGRRGGTEAGPWEVSTLLAAVKGSAWLDGHSHPEGDNTTFSLAEQLGHFVWPVASNICYC